MRDEEEKTIRLFGRGMKEKLDARSIKYGKMGWRGKSAIELLDWLEDEVKELRQATFGESDENIKKECADVANVAMFIWDIINGKK